MPSDHPSPVRRGEFGQYTRETIGFSARERLPIVRSFTPTLGEFYWLAVRGADMDWYPFGGRTFDTRRELDAFVAERGF